MKQTNMQFQIDQLRQEKAVAAVESIAVLVFSLFISAFLPQLLIRYVYASQALTEAPKLLEYIPLAAFTFGAVYFISAFASNMMRTIKIEKLTEEMNAECDSCSSCESCACGDSCGCGDKDDNWQELQELDKMVEEAMAETKKSKTVAASKKTATKTKKAKKATSKSK